jgi:hypothetical protein
VELSFSELKRPSKCWSRSCLKLLEDESLEERTVMTPSTICHLTNLCLTSTYFAFGEHLYEQIKGAPMGSPLSPVLADICMEFFETMAIEKADLKFTLWCLYVDDTFVVWPHGPTAPSKAFL